ncbi:MAG: hypothetical protein ACO307_09355, partial [Ilumatobacteraceae bacterium]
MSLDSHRSLDVPIVPDFLLPDDVDKRAARERLARLRATLAAHDVGAAVFFDALYVNRTGDDPAIDLSEESLFGNVLIITGLFEHLMCGTTQNRPHLIAH